MKKLQMIALILLIIGGINWGLIVFDFNLVHFIFRVMWLEKIIYLLVGISAIITLVHLKGCCCKHKAE
jgi:uncharacterized protein